MTLIRCLPYALLAVAALSASACGGPEVPKTPLGATSTGSFVPGATSELPPGLNASAAARLDSGNIAFRLKQYDQALHYYEAAAKDVPQHAAPWYGISMVGQATGNKALVDSATRAVAARSGGGDLLNTDMAKTHGVTDTAPLPKKHP